MADASEAGSSSAYLDVSAGYPEDADVPKMRAKELKEILRERGVEFVGVTEKRELVSLVLETKGKGKVNEAQREKNRTRELETGGILFTSTEDALVDQHEAKVSAMSNGELKRYLMNDLKVQIPAGISERGELLELALAGRPSTQTLDFTDGAENVSEHLLEA